MGGAAADAVAQLHARFRWDDVLERLDWDGRTRLNIAQEACVRWAVERARIAMIIESEDGRVDSLTYYELNLLSNRFANVLRGLGVRRGEAVAAVLPKVSEAFIAALAVWKLGATYVPIYTGFGPEAVRYRLERSSSVAVVTTAGYRNLVDEALPQDLPVVTVGAARGRGVRRGDLSFWEEVDRADPAHDIVETAPGDTAALVFTSGTTGLPKGCLIPHAGLVGLVPFVEHVMALDRSDLMWATADPSWVFGLMSTGVVPMALGYLRFIYEGGFDARRWWELMERHQITHVTGAPTAYRSLAGVGVRALAGRRLALRAATSAGEPLNPEPIRWFAEHAGIDIYDAYGLTEVGFAIGNLRSVGHPLRAGSAGFAIPGSDVTLLDDDGEPVGMGEAGTIAIRGHQWFLGSGYLDMDEEWKARWRGEWFVTGDTALRDEDGYFWFVGRHDDVIITSGFNVGPFEVESALVSHAAVAEAAVVGKADERRGHIVKAFVVLTGETPASETLVAELQDLVRKEVGRHAYPREIEFVDDLPRTISGKIRRAELRARGTGSGPA